MEKEHDVQTELEQHQVRPPTEPPTARPRSLLTSPSDVTQVARALGSGAVVAVGFANFYAIVTRPDAETVRGVNELKGRPPGQVGSITAPPSAVAAAWDLDALPSGLTRRAVLEVVDAFFGLGPFGFRGPAAVHVPDHLTVVEGGVRTAQVIAPGYGCPANRFLGRAVHETGGDLLYITSANRSRHLTGADDSPAHWRADGLVAEFGDRPGFVLLEHPDEAAARARYPRYAPMSTSILGLHTVSFLPGDRRPHLTLDRHGSLPVADVRAVLAELGFGLLVGPRAATRLLQRDYSLRLCDR